MSESRAAGVIAPGLFLRGELRGEDDPIIEGRVEGGDHPQEAPHRRDHRRHRRRRPDPEHHHQGRAPRQHDGRGEGREIHQGARVVGNITAPRIVIAEGARFKGHIDMTG